MGDAENFFSLGDEQFSSVQRSVFDSSEVDRAALGWQPNRGGGEGNF